MRVLLLGATGNLGLRLIPALLAHKHDVTVFVRSVSKLKSLVSPALIAMIVIVCGDATDSTAVKTAILENDCNVVVDTAGNQVLPWKEYQLPKIAKSVADAAVAVGRERGKPLRAWFMGAIALLQCPGTDYLVGEYLPRLVWEQHLGTRDVLEAISQSSLRWSLLCVPNMTAASLEIAPLVTPRAHGLALADGKLPDWTDSLAKQIPLIGRLFNLVLGYPRYIVDLEDAADFIAEDLEVKESRWEGSKVGMKKREKAA